MKLTSRYSFLATAVFILIAAGCSVNTLALRNQGQQDMNKGDYNSAANNFVKVLKYNPTDKKTLYLNGITMLKLNHPIEAQLDFEKALVLEPKGNSKRIIIRDKIAESLWQQDRPKALRKFLKKQVDKRNGVSDYLRQGKYLAKLGDMDNAKLAFHKAAYFAPRGDARPYMEAAKFYESIHDIPNVKKSLRYAYYVNPNDPRISAQLDKYNIVPGPTVKKKPPKPDLFK